MIEKHMTVIRLITALLKEFNLKNVTSHDDRREMKN